MPLQYREIYRTVLYKEGVVDLDTEDMALGAFEAHGPEPSHNVSEFLFLIPVAPDYTGKSYRGVFGHIREERKDGTIVVETFDPNYPEGSELHFIPMSLDRWRMTWASDEMIDTVQDREQMIEMLWQDFDPDGYWDREHNRALLRKAAGATSLPPGSLPYIS